MKKYIELLRDIPDFPKPGILFKDITPVIGDYDAFCELVEDFYQEFKEKKIDYVVGLESRGFIIGAALAMKLGVGFVPIRKQKKLPGKTYRHEFDLEYGSDVFEIHTDAIKENSNVLVIDDLLATGGSLIAAKSLLSHFNANIIAMAIFIELDFLNGRERLGDTPIFSLYHC